MSTMRSPTFDSFGSRELSGGSGGGGVCGGEGTPPPAKLEIKYS